MAITDAHLITQQDIVRRFRRIGLLGGAIFGLVIAIIAVGPKFGHLAPKVSTWALFGSTALFAAIGYFAGHIVGGMHAAGSAACPAPETGASSGGGVCDADSGGGDGGGDGE
jgi:hypothetical protein